MADVRSGTIFPVVSDFRSFDGTPLYVNRTNGRGYVLDVTDTIVPLVADSLPGLPFNVRDYLATGDGVTDDGAALTDTLDAAAVAGGTVYVPAGIYAYATSPNFARMGVNILCDRGALFLHTGTGQAFLQDGGTGASTLYGLRYDNLTIQGNSNSTNGLYVRNVHHSIWTHPWVLGCATTGAGIRLDYGVANEWHSPRVSTVEGTEHPLSPVPKYGMVLSRMGSGTAHSTTQTIVNPAFEGLTQANGAGLYIDFAMKNTIIGGTSENNTNGLIVTGDNGIGLNSFHGIFFEANSTADVQLQTGCVQQSFYDILCGGTVDLQGNTNRNKFYGGTIFVLTLGAATNYNLFDSLVFATSRTDSSLTSIYRGCTDPAGAIVYDKDSRMVVGTGSLPAGSAAMDGTMLIENAGADDVNLIIYARGEGHRIDGGVNVL